MKDLTLLPHQVQGVEFLQSTPRCILADDMGLGKTVTTLMALRPGSGAIVFAPKAAYDVWIEHCNLWRPDFSAELITQLRWPQANELLVVSKDTRIKTDLLKCKPNHNCQLISDEAQALKNGAHGCELRGKIVDEPGSARWNTFRQMSSVADGAWMLTGTPLVRDPLDLWSILDAAGCAQIAFGSFDEFVKLTRASVVQNRFSGWRPVLKFPPLPKDTLTAKLASVVLRRTKDILDPPLPSKFHVNIDVKMSDAHRASLDKLVVDFGGIKVVKETLTTGKLNKKQQQMISLIRRELAIAKGHCVVPHVRRVIDNNKQTVIFSDFVAPIDMLSQLPGVVGVTGNTKMDDRSKACRAFQAGEVQCFAGTIGSCGTALTLTRASTVFMIDRSWSPSLDLQAEDRVHRIGQTKAVKIYTLVADHDVDRMLDQVHRVKRTHVDAFGL